MADEFDDDDDLDLEDDIDDDDDDVDEDEESDDDIDIDDDDEEITREDALRYASHVESEHAKEKKRADQEAAEASILRKAMGKQAKEPKKSAKPTSDQIVDRDYEAGGRDIDKPFRI